MTSKKTKALGQHFLKNPYALRTIIDRISPQSQDFIIEIGPGKGVLTLPLAKKAGKIVAIEKDKALAAFLKNKNIPNLLILEGDVLKVDLQKLIWDENSAQRPVKIVGNLPYSISSPILFKIYEFKELFSFCVFLLQKEVAERISAGPGTKKFAPISILFQIVFETQIHAFFSPRSFTPSPKVDSALISLEKRQTPLFSLKDEQDFHRFLKMAFRSRRKTLINNFILSGYSRASLDNVFQRLEMEKMIRPEQVSIDCFLALYNELRAPSRSID
jgi:16S rRNA (adenine1518-N6/adenine1519-N6)-dimethyltransferase